MNFVKTTTIGGLVFMAPIINNTPLVTMNLTTPALRCTACA